MNPTAKKALVLGAGGFAASSWELGLVAGMADAGLDVRDAGRFVGTSAGARVAVQLASDVPLDDLLAQEANARPSQTPQVDWKRWRDDIAKAKAAGGDSAAVMRRMGALASTARSPEGDDRRRFVLATLPLHAWPERSIAIASVEVESGERRVFDASGGVALDDAVLASGALAGVYPAVAIDGLHYIDGGFYSTENADLAVGCERVLVLALRAGEPPLALTDLASAVRELEAGGARVAVVRPDDATQAIFDRAGGNMLDPRVRDGALRTGREQGRRVAVESVARFWRAF